MESTSNFDMQKLLHFAFESSIRLGAATQSLDWEAFPNRLEKSRLFRYLRRALLRRSIELAFYGAWDRPFRGAGLQFIWGNFRNSGDAFLGDRFVDLER
jgi:hypothetical protein